GVRQPGERHRAGDNVRRTPRLTAVGGRGETDLELARGRAARCGWIEVIGQSEPSRRAGTTGHVDAGDEVVLGAREGVDGDACDRGPLYPVRRRAHHDV